MPQARKTTRGIALPHLADWRKARFMTQRDLSAASGISQSSITQLETGTHTARIATIEKLAAALGISREQLTQAPTQNEAPTVATGRRIASAEPTQTTPAHTA